MLRAALLGLVLCAGGCTETRTLTVELQTDLVPELELGHVEIEVLRRYVPHDEVGVPVGGPFAYEPVAAHVAELRAGRRVAELSVAPGTYTVRVDARRPVPAGADPEEGTRVRDPVRDVVTTVAHTDRVVRVILLGSCGRVTCPIHPDGDMDVDAHGAMDRATECLNAECVDPRCDPSAADMTTRDYCCAGPACTTRAHCLNDGECTGLVASCADARCIEGACIAVDREGACPEDTYCDRTAGECLRFDGVTLHDAGVRTPRDADPAIDACPPEDCRNGIDDDCDGTLDCEDTECVGAPCDDDDPCTQTDVCIPVDDVGRSCAGTPMMCDADCDGRPDCEDPACAGLACDDGDPCTHTDVCDPLGGRGGCIGTTVSCTSSECMARTCNGTAACTETPIRAGEGCPDDGNECTQDVCNGGICTHPAAVPGTGCGGGICCGISCVNPSSDTSNCGVCGLTCAAGRSCQAGQCRCVGPSECVAGGYGPLAGCVSSLCECHCPGGLVSGTCTGQCPGTAHCLARPGAVGPDICEY